MSYVRELKKYIQDVLGVDVDINTNVRKSNLPFFLTDKYRIYNIIISNENFKMIQLKDKNDRVTPSELSKHIDIVRNRFNQSVIYTSSSMESFNRNRMIEKKIPFIIPFNQMYLPMLSIYLRERRTQKDKTREYLSPSAQMILIYLLTKGSLHDIRTKDFAERFKLSQMTIGRAFKEMELLELCEIKKINKQNNYIFNYDKSELFKRSIDFLRTPIYNELWINKGIEHNSLLYRSGISALSDYTNIAEDRIPEMAISKKLWNSIKQNSNGGKIASSPFEDSIKVEIWKYPPEATAKGDIVDKISLYLSLVDSEDERVQMELEKLRENIVNG